MAKQKAVPHGAGAGAHSGKGGPRKHRAGARITKVQDAFKKGGELAAFRKGAALRLSCSSIYKWCMAWRAQGIEPVVTPDPAAKLVNPLTKKGLKRLAKVIIKQRAEIANSVDVAAEMALPHLTRAYDLLVDKPAFRITDKNDAGKAAH